MGKVKKKNEFENPWSEFLGFNCGTPIMFIPYSHLFDSWFNVSFFEIFCG
jgi:hypothetical protein